MVTRWLTGRGVARGPRKPERFPLHSAVRCWVFSTMRTLVCVTVLVVAVPSLAGNAALTALDDTRVTALASDEATAARQLRAWADAIARGERELRNREALEVLAMEKDLYAAVYPAFEAIKACNGPSEETCTAALKSSEAAERAFEARRRDGPLWREYRQTWGITTINTASLRNTLRLGRARRERQTAWDTATATANQAVAARDAAFSAAGPDADEATLKTAVSAAAAADAACAAFNGLARTESPYPEGCPQRDAATPSGDSAMKARRRQLALIKNRLPASAEFSNAALCEQPCGNVTLCPPACPGATGDAAVLPDFDFNAVDAHLQVRRFFETVHPSRYRFLTRDAVVDGEVLARRGEVVLVTTLSPETRGSVLVLTLANDWLTVAPTMISATRIKGAKLTTLRQNECVVVGPDATGKQAQLGTRWDAVVDDSPPEGEPAFLQLMDPNDKAYAPFVNANDAFLACYEKTMKRLDPDGTAWRYVRETYVVRTGETLKVEKLDEGLRRQACGTCGCRKFNAARAALAAKVLGPLQKKDLEAHAATVKRIEARLTP